MVKRHLIVFENNKQDETVELSIW